MSGARADASTTPAAGDGGKGGGGLGAKTIGIVAGAVGAGGVVLSKCRMSSKPHQNCLICCLVMAACIAV